MLLGSMEWCLITVDDDARLVVAACGTQPRGGYRLCATQHPIRQHAGGLWVRMAIR